MTIIDTIAHCDWRELARRVREEVGMVDALVVDAPYSARTHSGHDAISEKASALGRREINYAPWSGDDVREFVETWSPLTRGWFVSLTDDVLSLQWRAAFEVAGRCGFAPLPFVQFGSRVRLSGDGPSSITTQISVARPRSMEFARWGTMPGAYVQPPGVGYRPEVVGGKTLWIMESLVRDYTRPGDLVCDPCAGGGTTLLAAKLLGRRYVGSDIDADHVEIARERLRDTPTREKAGTLALPWGDE